MGPDLFGAPPWGEFSNLIRAGASNRRPGDTNAWATTRNAASVRMALFLVLALFGASERRVCWRLAARIEEPCHIERARLCRLRATSAALCLSVRARACSTTAATSGIGAGVLALGP